MLVLRLKNGREIGSILWLLMPWIHAFIYHQHPLWYRQCRMQMSCWWSVAYRTLAILCDGCTIDTLSTEWLISMLQQNVFKSSETLWCMIISKQNFPAALMVCINIVAKTNVTSYIGEIIALFVFRLHRLLITEIYHDLSYRITLITHSISRGKQEGNQST